MKSVLMLFLSLVLMSHLSFFTSCKKEKIVIQEKEVIKNDTLTIVDTVSVNDTITLRDTVTVRINSRDTIVVFGDSSSSVKLHFDHMVGNDDFDLGSVFQVNGVPFKYDRFRYWLSNVVLIAEDGFRYEVPRSYFLMEETVAISLQDGMITYPAHKREEVLVSSIPFGKYKRIEFAVGVDAQYNDNLSLQSGELAQLNGMTNISWMWHTSYIFSMLHGTQDGDAFKIETGLNESFKTVSLDFPVSLEVKPKQVASLHVKVDVSKVADGVDLDAKPTIGANTKPEMAAVSANYQTKVFSVISVK